MSRPLHLVLPIALLASLVLTPPGSLASDTPPASYGAVPSERQLAWHRLEYYGFIHFTVNTFTDREWGMGSESRSLFAPTDLDPAQWVRVAKAAGMKGLILTAKHHDGFCLWPSRYTEHSVQNAPWKDGKGDVVRELADACAAEGLKMGVYLSPWDRNHAEYGRPAYLTYYRRQLEELLTGYGDIFEVWFDGANGGTGYYGGANEERRIDRQTYYEWPGTWALVRRLQPGAVMFSDAGPDTRWVGNEHGFGDETNWATLNRDELYPGCPRYRELPRGHRGGTHWVPAEADVSIRPGWFYHAKQDGQVKTVDQLLEIWYRSVGRGCNLLLNLPPDRRGRIHETDIARLMELRSILDRTFDRDLARGARVTATSVRGRGFAPRLLTDGDRSTYWAAPDLVRTADLVVDAGHPVRFDRVRLEEHVALGQRVEAFAVDVRVKDAWQEIATGTTIGPRRILRVKPVTAQRVRIRLVRCGACPTLSTVELYASPEAGVLRASRSR